MNARTACLTLLLVGGSSDWAHSATLEEPSAAEQNDALRVVKEAFADDFKQAKDGPKKLALGEKLLKQGRDTRDDAVGQFVLWKEAVRLGVEAGDARFPIQVIDTLDQEYSVDALAMKFQVLTALAKANKTVEQSKSLASAALQLIDDAVDANRYDDAKRLASIAGTAAKTAKDKLLSNEAAARGKEVDEIAQQFAKAADAMAVLKRKLSDPDASLQIGRFRCLYKGEWQSGLRLLAQSSDPELKAVAEKDLSSPTSPAEQAKLGDGWWKLGEREKGMAQQNLKRRAAEWYRKALPGLSGLTKASVEKRVSEVDEIQAGTSGTKQTVFLADLAPMKPTLNNSDPNSPSRLASKATINGNQPQHGLWAHPPASKSSSKISYHIRKQYGQLKGTCGLANQEPGHEKPRADGKSATPLTFRIVGDGKLLWKSRPIQKFGDAMSFEVSVRGVARLELFVDCPGDWSYAWAIWIDPALTK